MRTTNVGRPRAAPPLAAGVDDPPTSPRRHGAGLPLPRFRLPMNETRAGLGPRQSPAHSCLSSCFNLLTRTFSSCSVLRAASVLAAARARLACSCSCRSTSTSSRVIRRSRVSSLRVRSRSRWSTRVIRPRFRRTRRSVAAIAGCGGVGRAAREHRTDLGLLQVRSRFGEALYRLLQTPHQKRQWRTG